jgi:hypothetical protein
MISAQHISPAQPMANLFCRAPLPPTVRRINKSINERLDRYIRAEKLRQAQELWKTPPQPEWRVITEYPNYEVSTDGQVRNSGTGRVLKPGPKGCGYLGVGLRNEGKTHTKSIHRLVAQAFLPNPDGKLVIDHINRDKIDNHLENLRWATHTENNQNTGRRSNNTTGFKNITNDNTRDRWRIQIRSRKISRYFNKNLWTLEQVVDIRNNLYREHGIQQFD